MTELMQGPTSVAVIVMMVAVTIYVLRNLEWAPTFIFLVFAGLAALARSADITAGASRTNFVRAVILVVIGGTLFIGRLMRGKTIPFTHFAIVFLYIAVIIVSNLLVNSGDPDRIRAFVGTLLIALVVMLCPATDKTAKYLLIGFVTWGAANLLAAVGEWSGYGLAKLYATAEGMKGEAHHVYRLRGLMGHSTNLGLYLALAATAAHALTLQTRNHLIRVLLIGMIVAFVVGIFASLSRGAVGGFLVASLYVHYRLRGFNVRSIIGLFLATTVALGAVAAYNLDKLMTTRFSEMGTEESALGRIPLLQAAFKIYSREPIFGVGISQGGIYDKNILLNTHNTYMQVLFESGIVGFVLFSMILIVSIRGLLRHARNREGTAGPYYRGLFGVLLVILLEGLFHDQSYLMPLWILLGIGMMPVEARMPKDSSVAVKNPKDSARRRVLIDK